MNQSEILFERAKKSIPGGVNSPVRAFKSVSGCPIFFKQGRGAYLVDVDGKEYVDYVGSWGPMILGHCHPAVIKAVQEALPLGMSFGAPTELEILLAEKVRSLMPAIEKVRMVSSGTEATMTAIRLARAYTGREKILKFNGCYHGHSDSLLVRAGSGLLTLGIPSSPGVLQSIVEHTLSVDFNDLDAVKRCFAESGATIAGIIIEPVAGNMGLVKPKPGFLEGLRAICDQYQSLLIFDEVMTGFRVAKGGAQAYYQIKPDLTTLGKIIGAGMPVGAVGGAAKIMDNLAPEGAVYQAGTLSGNPLAMAAGLACLTELDKPDFYQQLESSGQSLVAALEEAAKAYSIPFHADFIGGMFGFYFSENKNIHSFADVDAADKMRFVQFYHGMLQQGIYFAPSMYEAGFFSSQHKVAEIEKTFEAAKRVFAQI